MSVLSYENVDISYNGNTVVKDINFKLDEGEILGIVGESGSGKTTVIKAAMNLLGKGGLVTRGDIWFKDMDIPDLSDKQ
ncbi:MAG: ATP-binding cassette domain-containing protein, partial [Pseudobutyrivibrio sp.]|uniref:ATP-binding cassette domain-containing protein n=1 Tax=Pseudobutyrivibrio sp. TaxID=2014367 RepID=UPI0025CBBF0C